jgi:hypothetical protein
LHPMTKMGEYRRRILFYPTFRTESLIWRHFYR